MSHHKRSAEGITSDQQWLLWAEGYSSQTQADRVLGGIVLRSMQVSLVYHAFDLR